MATPSQNNPLEVGKTLCGFRITGHEALPEIEGEAFILEHEVSKAKLLYLKNEDNNKAFSIAFKTPPVNDTGVFHILEHSVLCGSRKFPVKEPFVNLLKSSMQTFLNAMTFPDKTMYPVASTNEQDLLNLMDVYLDAVLHPQIYQKEAIFQQEGWHLEFAELANSEESSSEIAAADTVESTCKHTSPHLVFNGVVYNEMKGVFSDPTSVLYWQLMRELFPDTAYRFESGGAPESIPELSYEEYLDEHARHYRLDNSYITLYGNLDIERTLQFLDEEHLSPTAHEQSARDELRRNAGDSPLVPHALELQAPVISKANQYSLVTAPENACAALGFVAGTAHNRLDMLGISILLDALGGSNEAPLKRALLDANLAADASILLADSLLQPFAVIMLHGLNEGGAQKLRKVCLDTLETLAAGKLDHALIEASLSRSEFVAREGEFGYPDGVAHAMASLAGWLYDDSLPLDYLKYQNEFAQLREALSTSYFEDLIRRVFLESDHWAEMEIVPIEAPEISSEEKRLDDIAQTFSPDDFAQCAADVIELRRIQEEPDSAEALASLPLLSVADIDDAPCYAQPTLETNDQFKAVLRHQIATHGIAYTYRFFDLKHLTFEELPYVSLLATMLGHLDTTQHSASEIDTLINGKLGNFNVFPDVNDFVHDIDAVGLNLVVGASALSENSTYLSSLTNEILTHTLFEDIAKLKDVLQQRKVAMEQAFSAHGHASARARLTSYYSKAGVVREKLGGVDYYRFVKHILANFEAEAPLVLQKLQELSQSVFNYQNCVLSFTGTDEEFSEFMASITCLRNNLECSTPLEQSNDKTISTLEESIPLPSIKNEAFIVPSDVCYTAAGYDSRYFQGTYTGAWQVASRALTFDYLWNEVRVKGGAYGVGFQAARTGTLRFWSYRDPKLDETLDRFQSAVSWLAEFNPTPEEMEGYIVASVAEFDTPLKARQIIRRQSNDFLVGRTPEDRTQTRAEMIAATPKTLQELAPRIGEALGKKAYCAIGGADILKSSLHDFCLINLLEEDSSSNQAK